MTALVVVLMFVGFVVLDVVVRRMSQRMQERREHREREAVLETSMGTVVVKLYVQVTETVSF